MRKWIVPLLAVFISLASVFFSPTAVYADANTDYYCPSGYNYDSQYHLCSNGEDALGPFTPTMVQECQKYGGGEACSENTLSLDVAEQLRGTSTCPPGATLQSGFCIDGEYAYGPFSKQDVKICEQYGGGTACQSMRLAKSVALDIGQQNGSQPIPTPSPTYAGVDSCDPVTPQSISNAYSLLGTVPKFWGRYFNGLGYTDAPCEYIAAQEGPVLESNGIRVLPVARATEDVGGTYELGQTDGQEQAGDFVESFSNLDGQYVIFVDVEYGGNNPSLSTEYYQGWSEAISSYCPGGQGCSANVQLIPGVYLNGLDSTSSDNLQDAISSGSDCGGLWIASWGYSPTTEWNSSFASPATSVSCPVLFWQDAGDIDSLDADLSSPDYDALSYIPLP